MSSCPMKWEILTYQNTSLRALKLMGLALHTGHAGHAIRSLATFLANENFD